MFVTMMKLQSPLLVSLNAYERFRKQLKYIMYIYWDHLLFYVVRPYRKDPCVIQNPGKERFLFTLISYPTRRRYTHAPVRITVYHIHAMVRK